MVQEKSEKFFENFKIERKIILHNPVEAFAKLGNSRGTAIIGLIIDRINPRNYRFSFPNEERNYFAKLLGVSPGTISRMMTELVKLEVLKKRGNGSYYLNRRYIEIVYTHNGKNVDISEHIDIAKRQKSNKLIDTNNLTDNYYD